MAHFKVYMTSEEDDGVNRRVFGAAYSSVPAGVNDVGTPWTEVAAGLATFRNRRWGRTTEASVPVDQALQDELDAGTMFEWRWQAVIPVAATGPQAAAALRSAVAAQEAAMMARLANDTRYWGFEGDT